MKLKTVIFRCILPLLFSFVFCLTAFGYSINDSSVLSTEDLDWLKAHPVIKVAPDLGYAPIEFDNNGKIEGVAIDYLHWMEAHYPIKFKLVRFPTWQAQLDAMRAETIDMLSGAAKTPERSVYMHFTKPYISTPNVILRLKTSPPIRSENELIKLKVATIKGYAVGEFLRIRYPNLNIVPVSNISDGFLKLTNGDVDAMVTENFQASYYVSSLKMTNIALEDNYQIDFPLNLSMATRKNAPELALIIDKMIDSMPEADRLDIERKWISIDSQKGISETLVYGLIIVASVLIGALVLIVLWNRTLKGRVEEKTEALSALNTELEQKVERRTYLLSETNKQLEFSMYDLQQKDMELESLNHELEASLDTLKTTQRRVIEMEKVAALGKLVATVAHEINTPLGNLIMMNSYEWDKHEAFKIHLQHLNKIDETTEEYFYALENIHEILQSSLDRLTLIVNRFKSLAVQNLDQKYDQFDLIEVIDFCMHKYRLIQSFEWTITPDMPIMINGIKSAYEEVFSNLISNSVNHGFVDDLEGHGHISVSLECGTNSLTIEFKDNGIGISDELISKVVEPLFTTNRSGGIGINIIMNILSHTLDGEMAIDNTTGDGLRVVIMLRNINWVNAVDEKIELETTQED